MTTVQFELPDALAQQARSAGLLSASWLEQWLREQLRQEAVERLGQARTKLAAEPVAPMTTQGDPRRDRGLAQRATACDWFLRPTALSGLLWSATPGQLPDAAQAARFELASSTPLLAELRACSLEASSPGSWPSARWRWTIHLTAMRRW